MRARWVWYLFFFVVTVPLSGLRPLGEPDEGRYAEAARWMLVSGDWTIPRLQGIPHMTKPPITYWLAAGGMKVLGVNEWGARLGHAVAFFLTILCVVELARTWGMGATESRAAGLVFCTSLLTFVAGHLLTTDMILTLWITLGILALWKVWRGSERAALWRWVFWGSFALAFMTKGPPGWLPLAAAAIFAAASRTHRPLGRIFSIPAFFFFLGVSLSWYLVVIWRDPEWAGYFMGNEVVGRVLTNVHGRHKPWWIYVVTVFAGLTPWIFLWPSLVRRTAVEIKPELAERGGFPSFSRLRANVHETWLETRSRGEIHFVVFLWAMLRHTVEFMTFKAFHLWRRLTRLEDIKFFSFLWFFVPLAVFTFAKSRMYLYLVPIFVPLSVWAGHVLVAGRPTLLPTGRARRWAVAGAALWCVAALGFLCVPDSPDLGRSHRRFARQMREIARQAGTNRVYAISEPPHSLSFYSGLVIRELDEDAEDVLDYLRGSGRPAQGPALLQIGSNKLKKLSDKGYTILANDGEEALLRVETRPKPVPPPTVPVNHP